MRQACLVIGSLGAMVVAGCTNAGGVRPSLGGVGFSTPASATVSTVQAGLVSQASVQLSRSELAAALAAEQSALEKAQAGKPVEWQGEAGRGGTVIAAQPYRVGSQDCRPYTHMVRAGGPTQSVRGTACRNPDGSWSLLN